MALLVLSDALPVILILKAPGLDCTNPAVRSIPSDGGLRS